MIVRNEFLRTIVRVVNVQRINLKAKSRFLIKESRIELDYHLMCYMRCNKRT